MFKAELFDESIDSYGGYINTKERISLALETAEKSIVLLKNSHLLGQEKTFCHLIKIKLKLLQCWSLMLRLHV